MTLEFDFFNTSDYQVGYRPKYGHGAQSQLVTIPAVTKHGELTSRERCPLPLDEIRTASGSRTAFSDMTRSMNAMPQHLSAPTSNPRPDYGTGMCAPKRNLQVAMPASQPCLSDELNTPVISMVKDDPFDLMSEPCLAEMEAPELSPFGTGISFSQPTVDSQELFCTLFPSQQPIAPTEEHEMPPPAVAPSTRCELKLDFQLIANNATYTDLQTPEIMKTLDQPFNLLDFINGSSQEAKLHLIDDDTPEDPLAMEEDIKCEPGSPSTDDYVSSGAGSPSALHIAMPSANYSEDSDASVMALPMRPQGPYGSGASMGGRRGDFDDISSIASSANEMKVHESRFRNNLASRRSRVNKKTRDEVNQIELRKLSTHHRFLTYKVGTLETIRDELRSLVKATFNK